MDERTAQPMPQDSDQIVVNGVSFSHLDIFKVVDEFYTLIQQDSILKVPFASVHDWPEHVVRLTHFWWIRFGGKPYLFAQYNPVAKHFFAGFTPELLTRWLGIFHGVLKKNLTTEQTAFWALVSSKMGDSLSARNESLRQEHADDKK